MCEEVTYLCLVENHLLYLYFGVALGLLLYHAISFLKLLLQFASDFLVMVTICLLQKLFKLKKNPKQNRCRQVVLVFINVYIPSQISKKIT